jgi:hypothetical protein
MNRSSTNKVCLALLATVLATTGSTASAQNTHEEAVALLKKADDERTGKKTPEPLGAAEAIEKQRNAEAKRQELIREDRYLRLRDALRDFQVAQQELGEALGFKAKLKTPAQKLQKNAKVFLGALSDYGKKRPSIDSGEFKNLGQAELGWEALTAAERITPGLAAFVASEKQHVVDVQFLSFLPALEAQLLRLEWVTRQLK